MALQRTCWPVKLATIALLLCLILAIFCLDNKFALADDEPEFQVAEQNINKVTWWKKTNFYHIYLRSFKDSTGDGNGDLRGVIEKLDYLKLIGVETLLMAPFYASPMKDCGYDIEDYEAINPMFGQMKDFEDLVSELTKRNMKIVVDFVPNHSSDKHKWFECSERAYREPERCGQYKDYYVWVNSTRFEGKYPSNWVSVFGGGTAWKWSNIRQEFYLHQFLPEQPDLNFRNPAVREEFKRIARFWLRKGAAGLRVDSAIYLIEDDTYPDEPPNPDWVPGDDPFERLDHIYTRSLHLSAEITQDWLNIAREPEFVNLDKVIITEAYDKIPKLIEYYGTSPENRYADLPFNFELLKLKANNFNAKQIERLAMSWLEPTRKLNWPDEQGAMSPWIIWVTGNHDNSRMANRTGLENVPILQWISYLMPGVPVNYAGDEIPIHDAHFDTIPPKTLAEGEITRMPFRVPMAWTPAEPSGGFSSSKDIWLPVNKNYKRNNVETLLADTNTRPRNNLQLFLAMQKYRQQHLSLFVFGDMVFYPDENQSSSAILAIGRVSDKFGNILYLANLDRDNKVTARLLPGQSAIRRARVLAPPKRGKVVLINYEEPGLAYSEGQEINLASVTLAPSQAILIEY